MSTKRSARWAAAAVLASAAAFSGMGFVDAGSGPAATQVSTSPTAMLAYASVPPAYGDGTPAFEALLVAPGVGAVTSGSDGQMDMGRPWVALRAYKPDSTGITATETCTTVTNATVWHIDGAGASLPLTASFEAACASDVYRVNLTEWSVPFQSTMTAPYELNKSWGSVGTSPTTIHLSYWEGAFHYPATAQICRQAGTTWDCYAPVPDAAVIAPSATALAVQEVSTN